MGADASPKSANVGELKNGTGDTPNQKQGLNFTSFVLLCYFQEKIPFRNLWR